MCGRYFIDSKDYEMQQLLKSTNSDEMPQISRGEIFPTATTLILYNDNEKIKPHAALWGFPKFQGKGVIINARSETALEKRTFSESVLNRRCIIPANGFYEWNHQKQKYFYKLPNSNILYMAGFFKDFNNKRCFMILTSPANESVAKIHERMPLIVSKELVNPWINDTDFAANYLNKESPELIMQIIN